MAAPSHARRLRAREQVANNSFLADLMSFPRPGTNPCYTFVPAQVNISFILNRRGGWSPLPATKMIYGYRLATSAEPMGPGRLEGYWAQCSICVAIPDTTEK